MRKTLVNGQLRLATPKAFEGLPKVANVSDLSLDRFVEEKKAEVTRPHYIKVLHSDGPTELLFYCPSCGVVFRDEEICNLFDLSESRFPGTNVGSCPSCTQWTPFILVPQPSADRHLICLFKSHGDSYRRLIAIATIDSIIDSILLRFPEVEASEQEDMEEV